MEKHNEKILQDANFLGLTGSLFIALLSQRINLWRIKGHDDGTVYFILPDAPDFFFAITQDHANITVVGIALQRVDLFHFPSIRRDQVLAKQLEIRRAACPTQSSGVKYVDLVVQSEFTDVRMLELG